MIYLMIANYVAALAAVGLMVLVTIGFAPHLRFRIRGHDTNSLMSIFVAVIAATSWVRILYWSLLRPMFGVVGWMPPGNFTMLGLSVNIGFSLAACVAALAAMGALYYSLPTWAQREWGFFRAPFYPHKFTITWRW
jgi:hypothetical protein